LVGFAIYHLRDFQAALRHRTVEWPRQYDLAALARVCHEPPASKSFEGAGNAGRSAAPAASCVKNKTHEFVTTVTPVSPGIPRAMVFTVSFVLSLAIGLYCHHHRRITPPI
jgi:hypothetical protein